MAKTSQLVRRVPGGAYKKEGSTTYYDSLPCVSDILHPFFPLRHPGPRSTGGSIRTISQRKDNGRFRRQNPPE